jgi:hypothetical protein
MAGNFRGGWLCGAVRFELAEVFGAGHPASSGARSSTQLELSAAGSSAASEGSTPIVVA